MAALSSSTTPVPADTTITVQKASHMGGPRTLRIVHVSDTHDKAYHLPDGDVLVHSGDMTHTASPAELERFRDYIRHLPHRHKVIVCGAHEAGLDRIPPAEITAKLAGNAPDCHVLHDAQISIEGLKFYGSPWNNSARAFAMSPEACEIKFQRIPTDTDVLVTHQPPFGVLDVAYPSGQMRQTPDEEDRCADCGGPSHPGGKHWGSTPLRRRVESLGIPLHCFGRSHHSAGVISVGRTTFSNGAMEVKGRPVVIDVTVHAPPSPAPPTGMPPAMLVGSNGGSVPLSMAAQAGAGPQQLPTVASMVLPPAQGGVSPPSYVGSHHQPVYASAAASGAQQQQQPQPQLHLQHQQFHLQQQQPQPQP